MGVVAVIRDQNSASSFHLIDLDSVDEKRSSTIVEYAVKMNEFDSSQEFIRLHERGDLEPKHIHDLAKILAATHSRAEVHREDSCRLTINEE